MLPSSKGAVMAEPLMICTDTVGLNGLARILYRATTASNDPYCLKKG